MKILRFIGSLVLLPLCAAVTMSFYHNISVIRSVSQSGLIFIVGALSYSLVHLVLFRLDFLYVLGHELMHAVTTLFSGGKVLGIKVSDKGGSVKTTTPNFFVTLAPYFVPFYTVVIGVVYFILSFFIDISRYLPLFIFLVGFTLMFHLAYTGDSIKEKQSDLVRSGYLWSISCIYIVNLVIVCFIINLLFKEVSFFDFLLGACERSKAFYYSFWKQLFL